MNNNNFSSILSPAPQEAQDSHKRLQIVFENALDAILLVDRELHFVDANPAACVLTGYSREELLELSVADITPPTKRELLDTLWKILISAGKLEDEYEVLCKHGGTIIVEFRAVANVVPDLCFAILHDVTARKLAEESMRNAQARSESILAGIGDSYILFNMAWQYTYVNEAAIRAIGRAREEILGRSLWDVYPDIIGTQLDCEYHRAMEERIPATFEFHHEAPDTWWEYRFYPVAEGLAVFATNITERKRAEVLRAHLAAIVETSDEAMFSKSLDGTILSWNEGAEKLYGYTAEQAIGQSVSIIIPRDRSEEHRGIMQRLRKGEGIQRYETNRVRRDGRLVSVSVSISPVLDSAGHIVSIASIAHDITDRKRASAEQTRLFEELSKSHQQLRGLSSRLVEVEEAARRRMAREIHDDISQSLTALMMHLGAAKSLLPRSARAVQAILQETESLTATILERTRSMIVELRPPVLDDLGLTPALRRLADDLHEKAGVTVTINILDIPRRLPPQIEIALFRITQEALTNIRRHARAQHGTVFLSQNSEKISLSVQDDGVGIENQLSQHDNQHDFVLAGEQRIPAGHFGLIGIQERVNLLNGKMEVTSVPNQGTTLHVELPL